MASPSIGDLFMRVLADMTGFESDLVKKSEKAGDKAGGSLGQSMGSAIKRNGAKILGGALATGLGIMAKGVLELKNITADFQAETGASADEADRAGKSINRMAGRNMQPLSEVGQALTKVYTEMGLVGDEADTLTERFLKFGRVTKRNAADEVAAFDDILDAWNLTADHAGAIMDALTVSHQKFGGSVADDEVALRDLAPVLLAANQTWEDGLALINLFKSSGADVSTIVTGITKALAKVKNPAQLKAMIEEISAIEDPFLRAQKAADLFGAKAGAKLANVLKPGVTGLEDYKITVEEAAGATLKAADVLDSTWGARFQLLLKGAGAAIIEFGNDWGGLATVIATTLTVAGHLGGAKLVGALTGSLKGVWSKVGSSTILKAAIGRAGSMAATTYLAALMAGDALGGAAGKGMDKLGAALGTRIGKALSLAFAAVAVVEVVKTYNEINDQIKAQGAELAKQTGDFVKTATLEALQTARRGVREDLDKVATVGPWDIFGGKAIVQQQLDQIDAEITRRGGEIPEHVTKSWQAWSKAGGFRGVASAMTSAMTGTAANVGKAADDMTTSLGDVGHAAGDLAVEFDDTETSMRGNLSRVRAGLRAWRDDMIGTVRSLIDKAFNPLIERDDLLADRAELNAQRRALAAAKAGSAEAREAQAAIHKLEKSVLDHQINLLEMGALSKKEQAQLTKDLQAEIKKSTGATKTYLQGVLALIKEIGTAGKLVPINFETSVGGLGATIRKGMRHLAGGGDIAAHEPVVVGDGGRSEIFAPSVPGRLYPSVESGRTALDAAPAGDTIHLTLPVQKAPDPFEVVRQLRRAAEFKPRVRQVVKR